MQILHVLDHSLPFQSGYVSRTLGILAAQQALGWRTHQQTSPKQGPCEKDLDEVSGWTFFRTKVPKGLASKFVVLNEYAEMAATAERMQQIIQDVRPDVIHAHSPVLNGIPAIRVGLRHGIPVVYEMRALWEDAAVNHGFTKSGSLRYRLSRALESYALRQANYVTTICNGLKAEILRRGIPEGKVVVIPNAVDLNSFSGAQARNDELAARYELEGHLVLGFIGSFYGYEGLDLLLRALPLLVQKIPRIKLLLVGSGPEEVRLKAITHALKLERNVVFTGRVHHQEVRDYYGLVDLCIYPRYSTSLTEVVTPLKPLEAMAQNKVVIASNVGGHRELIADGVTGFLFQAGDVQALVKRVEDTLGQHEDWPVLMANGRKFVEKERSWESCVRNYIPVYGSLIEASRHRTCRTHTRASHDCA